MQFECGLSLLEEGSSSQMKKASKEAVLPIPLQHLLETKRGF
jgi:hypothetical protein